MITAPNQSLLQQSDALYERYGKPLEKTHRGKYIAISKAEVVASFRWRNDGSHRPGWQAPGAYAGEAIRKMRGMASQHAGQVCA
jgi:hypothetical protein